MASGTSGFDSVRGAKIETQKLRDRAPPCVLAAHGGAAGSHTGMNRVLAKPAIGRLRETANAPTAFL